MKMTSLCYLEKDGCYLMLHRVKKENDENRDKWIGVGGKFEDGESPEDCMKREVFEETGLTVKKYRYRGVITFVSDRFPTEYMHLFTADAWEGCEHDCDEGELVWVPKEKIKDLTLWEGDLIFLSLLRENVPFFSLKLVYHGDTMIEAILNGQKIRACQKAQNEKGKYEKDCF